MKKDKYLVGEEVFIKHTWFCNNIAPSTTSEELLEEYKIKLVNNFNISE